LAEAEAPAPALALAPLALHGVRAASALAAWFFGLAQARVDGATRGSVEEALARQTAMYLSAQALRLSAHQIGLAMGRHTSTIEHGILTIEDAREAEPAFGAILDVLAAALRASLGYQGAKQEA
jgi:hypothetical protein